MHHTGDQPSIYFAGGFGYNATRNSQVTDYIAQQYGRETVPTLPDPDSRTADTGFSMVVEGVATQVTRRQAFRSASKPSVETSVAAFQQLRSSELTSMLEEQGYEKVDAIFQSADALNGQLAVCEHPELFSNVVFAYPAGVIRQPNPWKASGGVVKSVFRGRRPQYSVPTDNSFEILEARSKRRSGPKTAGGFVTAASVALSYQAPLLSEVRKRSDAPGISYVVGLDDWMIRPERVLKSLSSPHDVDYVLITDTPHGIKGRKDVMDRVLELFPLMEQAKENRRTGRDAKRPLTDRIIFMDTVPQATRQELLSLTAKVDARANG